MRPNGAALSASSAVRDGDLDRLLEPFMKEIHRLAASLLAIASFFVATPARACSVCGCGDPLLTATDPAAITGRLRFEIDTEYLRIDAGTDGQPGSTDKLTQWSYRLNAVYRPLDALALSATVPLVSKTIHTVGGGTDVLGSATWTSPAGTPPGGQ